LSTDFGFSEQAANKIVAAKAIQLVFLKAKEFSFKDS
jgi:hypothetical protein